MSFLLSKGGRGDALFRYRKPDHWAAAPQRKYSFKVPAA